MKAVVSALIVPAAIIILTLFVWAIAAWLDDWLTPPEHRRRQPRVR